MWKFSLKAFVQKTMLNFFAKIVQTASFCPILAFQRAIKSLNPMTGSRSNIDLVG